MGLFSFLFGGGKKKAAKEAALKAADSVEHVETPIEAPELAPRDPAAIAIDAEPAPPRHLPAVGVAGLKHAYAAYLRAGDDAGAYAAACRLARLYTIVGARGLRREWRAAADERFAVLLAKASGDKRRTTLVAIERQVKAAGARSARARVAAAVGRLSGPEAARLASVHAAFLAKLETPGSGKAA